MINILHLSPWPLGGAVTFVINLAKVLDAAEVPYRVVRLAKNTEKRKRQIGQYGVWYQNVSFESAAKGKGVWLLASAPTDESIAMRAIELVNNSHGACVFHDPYEFKQYPHWKYADHSRVVCVRENGLVSMPLGKFIPHPYVRHAANSLDQRTQHAVSIARVSSAKNSLLVLQANTELPDDRRVVLLGALNRFWWNFNVKPKYPDWPMPSSTGFPRVAGSAVHACSGYEYMVDLTVFAGDGGGTQYSFLEAMDAGAVPVMSADWCSYKGVAAKLGFQVADKDGLVTLLNDDSQRAVAQAFRVHNYNYLDTVHAPTRIAQRYIEYLM